MASFVARRLANAAGLLLVISAISFWLTRLLPGDPARAILGITATRAQVAAERRHLGLDVPVAAAYLRWLGGAIRGRLGASWFNGEPVAQAIASKLPVTLSLAIGATVVAGLAGVAVGLLAAVRRGAADRLLNAVLTVAFAIPGFVLSLALVVAFAIRLRWFPATGYVSPSASPLLWLQSITLPVLALAVGPAAIVAQQIRAAAGDVLGRDYVRTLRSRGLPRWRLYGRHVLRNTAPAALTALSIQFIGLLGGAIVVETVFALPGLGSFAAQASTQGDIPEIQGLVIVLVCVVVAVNLLVDLCYAWLNPRVRAA